MYLRNFVHQGEKQLETINGESGTHISELVIVWQRESALKDGIRPNSLTRSAGQSATESITRQQRAGGDMVSESGVGLAIIFALGICSDRDEPQGNSQVMADKG